MNNSWPLLRIVVPKFPHINIYSRAAKTTTDLGSTMLASVADKLWGWRVEVINENNYHGPKKPDGSPDHEALQKENPASIVGFCCGLSSTIERVWELADYYKSQGVTTIAGGWHAHYCPEETLRHNIDLVVHGDGEPVIWTILSNFADGLPLYSDVTGCSFLTPDGSVVHNSQEGKLLPQIPDMDKALVALRNEVKDLDNLPFPNYGLVKYAKLSARKTHYPIGRTRGCGFNCEFCSVKGGVHSASARHLFETVNWLVATRGAKKFFIVDDRLEEDLPGTIEFFRLIKQKYGNRLSFLVQIRLESAENLELITAMTEAGVRTVCIGYESPIDEDLKAMRKGFASAKMLEWTQILGRYFWIHAMCIFGYPAKDGNSGIPAREMENRFKIFIRKANKVAKRGLSIQILKAVPAIGTDLRRRLAKEGVLFPLELLPWRYYDGNWACFMPKNMTLQEFQQIPIQLMSWFYYPLSFAKICLKTLVFPVDYLVRGWHEWKRGWYRDVVIYAGSRLMQKWRERHNPQNLTVKMQNYWDAKSPK